jgi:hypothetical protein
MTAEAAVSSARTSHRLAGPLSMIGLIGRLTTAPQVTRRPFGKRWQVQDNDL